MKDMDPSALHRAIFSPSAAYRVPEELWASIFKLSYNSSCVFVDDPFDEPTLIQPSHPLHVIANVCRSWRDIVESLPVLWTRIGLLQDFWQPPKKDASAYFAAKHRILSNILRHSRNLPLQIFIKAPYDEHLCPLLFAFMLLIAEHSHRWISLSIRDDAGSSINCALTSATYILGIKELPSLEILSVGWEDKRADALGTKDSWIRTMNLPKLRKVDFVNAYVPGFVSLDGVKELEFTNIPLDERWVALRASSHSSIETISVIDEDCDEEEDDTRPSRSLLTFPALERLHVRGSANSGVAHMTGPKLRELVICGGVWGKDIKKITSFIKRSKCLLTTVNIPCVWEDDSEDIVLIDAITALIPYLSDVKALRFGLHGDSVVEVFSRALSQTKDGRWCNFHSLEHLQLEVDYFEPFLSAISFSILIDMIEKRWQISQFTGVPALRKVEGLRVVLSMREELDCLRRLEVMEAEGLGMS